MIDKSNNDIQMNQLNTKINSIEQIAAASNAQSSSVINRLGSKID